MGKSKTVQFAFSYGSTKEEECYAFYTANGKCHADFTDSEGKRHTYSGVPMPEGFWDSLAELAEKHGMFEWKAPKLFHRFVINVDIGVLNVEILFPDGRKIKANSMGGDPPKLEDVATALKELYSSLEQ